MSRQSDWVRKAFIVRLLCALSRTNCSAHTKKADAESLPKKACKLLGRKGKCRENEITAPDFLITVLHVNRAIYECINPSQKVLPSNPEVVYQLPEIQLNLFKEPHNTPRQICPRAYSATHLLMSARISFAITSLSTILTWR